MSVSPQNASVHHGELAGPRLLVTGGIHGDEPCGPVAIARLESALASGDIAMRSGVLSTIGICNPAAFVRRVRYYERNMNRHFYPKDRPDSYEDRLINELAPQLEKADYLLDIHSYHSGGPPFAFINKGDEGSRYMASMLGVDATISGFGQAYANAGIEQSKWTSMGTTEYAREHGASALTLECGQHDDPQSIATAWGAILGILHHMGMARIHDDLAENIPDMKTSGEMACTQAVQVVYKDRPGHFTADWTHLQPVAKDTVIAEYKDGGKVRVPEDDMRLIMPRRSSPVGEEWLYFGRTTSLECLSRPD
jgi:predicted deacylase